MAELDLARSILRTNLYLYVFFGATDVGKLPTNKIGEFEYDS